MLMIKNPPLPGLPPRLPLLPPPAWGPAMPWHGQPQPAPRHGKHHHAHGHVWPGGGDHFVRPARPHMVLYGGPTPGQAPHET